MNHLVNSIPGGIASYKVENNVFIPTFFSDGVAQLTGHSPQEFQAITGQNAMPAIIRRIVNGWKKRRCRR
ncbi:MAG: hypothetical protein ACLSFJ_02715 [Holdemania filiformis]